METPGCSTPGEKVDHGKVPSAAMVQKAKEAKAADAGPFYLNGAKRPEGDNA